MSRAPTPPTSVPQIGTTSASPDRSSGRSIQRRARVCATGWHLSPWRLIVLMALFCGLSFPWPGWANRVSGALAIRGAAAVPGTFPYVGSPVMNTIVPPGSSTPISRDFFGMTIHHTATPFPAFPVSIFRFWDVVPWSAAEPSSGHFDWTRMDNTIARFKQNHVGDFIFTFGGVPAWASTNPTEPCPGGGSVGSCAPPDMTAFDDFATHLVQRYCGSIRYYETWNEPNGAGFWKGNNAQLLAVAQHLYRIAKDPANCGCTNGACAPNGGANPNKLLTPSISRITQSNLNWLNSYLADAGARYPYADIVAFHGYGSAGNPEEIITQVQSLKQILAKHGLSNLPLWNTEASWGSISQAGRQQASWLMRSHIAQAAAGVSRFVWYAYDNCGWGTLWEAPWCKDPQMPKSQVTDAGEAYAVIENWLAGASLAKCNQYQNGLWACELLRTGHYDAWIIWSSAGVDIPVPLPTDSGLTVYRDWQNNLNTLPAEITVNQMPVLLESRDLADTNVLATQRK